MDISEIFQKIEASADAQNLSSKERNVLRLLGEEMFGMTDHLVAITDLDFFVTNEANNFELHLIAKADISPDKKKEFVEASSHKENEKEKGLKNKIKSMFSDFFYMNASDVGAMNQYGVFAGADGSYYAMWSMGNYMDTAPIEEQKDDWDGLEKSILINVADDIIIGATTSQVEMIVKKHFK